MKTFIIVFLFGLTGAFAQQPVTILKRYNQHSYEDRLLGSRNGFLDIKDGTNFFNQYESLITAGNAWPPLLANSYVTNYYIWSYIAANGMFVVADSVQWINTAGGINLILIDQPLLPGITPRFPYPHLGTNTVNTVYTSLEDKGDTLLLIARNMNPVPGLSYNKAWYYRLNFYGGGEFHTGVALAAGGTRLLCVNQSDLIDGSNHAFVPPGFFDGGYYAGSPVEYMPLNPSHNLAVGTAYSSPTIPTKHYIVDTYIPSYFMNR